MKKVILKWTAVVLAVLMLTGIPFSASAVTENTDITESSVATEEILNYGCLSKIEFYVARVPVPDNQPHYSPIYDDVNGFRRGTDIETWRSWIIDYKGNDLSIEMPKSATSVALANFPKNAVFEKVIFPSSMREIYSFMPSEEAGDFYCKYYECDESNKYFCTVDGVLYTKDMKTLILYPNAGENEAFVLPDSVETVFDYAFSNSKNLEKITLNRNVKIGTGAFFNCNNLKIVKKHPVYPSYYWRGCFYGCNSVFAPFGLLIKAENSDLPEGWENSTQTASVGLLEIMPGPHSVLKPVSKIINKVAEKFTERFKNRISSSESSSVISSEDSSVSLFVEICIAVIKIVEVFLPGLN